MGHRRGVSALLAAAAVCLLIAGVSGYARFAVLDEGAFADRAVGTLASDEVREEVGARMGRRLADQRAELQHRLDGPVPAMADVPLVTLGAEGRERTLRRLGPAAHDLAGPLALSFGLVAALLLGPAFAREPDRRRAMWGAGLAVAAAGGLAAAGVTAAQDVVLDNFGTGFGDAVAATVWGAYVGDLRLWAFAAGAAGLVVAAAAGGPRPALSTLLVPRSADPGGRGRGSAARADRRRDRPGLRPGQAAAASGSAPICRSTASAFQ